MMEKVLEHFPKWLGKLAEYAACCCAVGLLNQYAVLRLYLSLEPSFTMCPCTPCCLIPPANFHMLPVTACYSKKCKHWFRDDGSLIALDPSSEGAKYIAKMKSLRVCTALLPGFPFCTLFQSRGNH